MRSISVLLALAGPVLAEIWLPVNGGDTHQAVFLADRVPAATPITRVPRVAIIGAGPGGSSAAFFLAQLAERNSSLTTDVTLFERSDYIGGRSTTVPVPSADEDDVYAELGATIFVKANRNLWKAAGRFNLTLQEGHGGGSTEEKGGVAVYDGETFVYHEAVGSSYYWNLAKLLWKYGRAPLQVRSLVRSLVTSFVALYGAEFQRKGPFSHPVAFADALNLSGMFEQDVQAYFDGQGVGQAFVSDFVGAAVRVNYGQSPASIHALEGLVALAAEGASSVQGGNRRIFERFVAESRATVRLETAVAEVVRLDGSQGWLIPGQGVFDVVLLAAPYHQSGLRIGGARVAHVPEQAYVHLHVTLVLTSAPAPKGEFYAEAFRGKPAPRTVLSTFAYADAGLKRRPRLNSHNALRRVDGKWLYKLFSKDRVDDDLLEDLFGLETVAWVHRKEWDAYPRAPPMLRSDLPPFELAPNLFYLNAFEPLISCMETATVSAFNAVQLVTQRLFDYTRQLVGSHAIASAVVKLLREVVAAARFPTFEALIGHLQEIGLRLEQAAPHDFVIGNIVRRVIKFLREEYTTALETAVPSVPQTPATFAAPPAGTSESPGPSAINDFFTSAPAFRRQSTGLPSSSSSASLSRHTSLPAYQPSVTTMLDLLGHHGPMPLLHTSATSTAAPDSPGSPARAGTPLSPVSFSPALSRAPSYAQIRRSTATTADDTDFSRRSHELKPIFVDAIAELRDELDMVYETVGAQAAEHIHSGEIIMTLGHSRTVEAFLKAAARKRKFTVVVIETAPSFTGRQLALALSTADPPIDAVLIPDAAVFALMSRCSKVLLGAHSVLADGSLLAIAGSLPAVRAAKAHLVPVVCCAGMFKFAPRFLGEAAYGALDWGSPAEVLKPIETPAIAEILNPYYDRVPSELISLFVTNIGGHPPSMCSRLLADMYG